MFIIQKIENFIEEVWSLDKEIRSEIKSLSKANALLTEIRKDLNRARKYLDVGLIKEANKILNRVDELQDEVDELLMGA